MKYFSLFSGIGGFELGIQQAYEEIGGIENIPKKPEWEEKGKTVRNEERQFSEQYNNTSIRFTCVGYSETDKYAIQIYERHFNHKNYGDITKIDAEGLPDFELLCGGFPCQSFSIAGKRGGFQDTRGTLFFDIARIAEAKNPRILFLENVKGLLSHDKGRTFNTIIATLDELGYDLQWQVLNSKNFGVPQNRERVFIIGHLRGTSRPKVFPIGESNKKDIKQLNQPTHSNNRVYGEEGISPSLNTMQGGNRQPKILRVSGDRGKQKKYLSDETGTLSANPMSDNLPRVIENSKIRRLTPTECERLQGFPDGWTEGVSDTQRYKTLGNAVTVNVIKEIAKKIGQKGRKV